MIKEACVESFKEAKLMIEYGADRIELCENLAVGGTTPSYGTIKECLKKLSVPTFVMIRPRGGDFVYSEDEINIIQNDILLCKDLGVKGIVLGVLTKENTIDNSLLKSLIALSSPMQITFHKAIDEVSDPLTALEILIELGVNRVLTSGKAETALEGKNLLKKMITKAGDKITIVVAGKVTKENFHDIHHLIQNNEYHGKKIVL
ncbi:MAG: copper homeostasis protein CutC [Fusobacteriaceae bacterium]